MVAIGFKIKAVGYDEIKDESKKEDEIKRSIGDVGGRICRRKLNNRQTHGKVKIY